jgi:hypothetical protein
MKVNGKTIKNKEKEFNMKVGTGTKGSLLTA